MRLGPWFLGCVLLVGAGSAFAQANPAVEREARERFQRGVELTDEGSYSAAMAEFQRAYELTHNAQVLFNISATHEALANYVDALEAMQRYEQLAPPAVVQRRRADIDAALTRLRGRVGTLVIALDVPGLQIRIDNIDRPADRARTGIAVTSGRHRVALSAPGHQSRESEHDVAGGTRVEIREPLQRVQSTIALECNVDAAEIVIDGRVVGRTPAASPIGVAEGLHNVEVRRDGYASYTTAVNATGVGARVMARLDWATPMPVGVGAQLVIRATESGAVAFLDGRRITLDGGDRVPPGPHRLRVERTDYVPFERDVNLTAGQSQTIEADLAAMPAYRERRLAESGRARAVAWTFTIGGGVLAIAGGVIFGFAYPRFAEVAPTSDALGVSPPPECPSVPDPARPDGPPLTNQCLLPGWRRSFVPANILADCSSAAGVDYFNRGRTTMRGGVMMVCNAAIGDVYGGEYTVWGTMSVVAGITGAVGVVGLVTGIVLHATAPGVGGLQRGATARIPIVPTISRDSVGFALQF